MRNGLEKRLSRLKKRVAERTEGPKVCNCRFSTRFHNVKCLDVVLRGKPRSCRVHALTCTGGTETNVPERSCSGSSRRHSLFDFG